MARIRSVHPDLLASITLAEMGYDPGNRAMLERTFVRLWPVCDDQGRVRDHMALLKASMYPAHEEVTPMSLDAELWQLAEADLIVRYTTPTRTNVIQVLSWHEYQHPQRATGSKLTELSTDCEVRTRVPLPNLSLLTHSLSPEPSSLEGRGEEGMGEESAPVDNRPVEILGGEHA